MNLRRRLAESAGSGARALGAAGICWIVLLSAVSLGLRIPGEEEVEPLSSPGKLDYALTFGETFRPLATSFISRVLGLDLGSENLARRAASGGDRSRVFGEQERVIVNHPFNNDDFSKAFVIPSIPFTARTQTTNSTRQTEEPTSCSPTGGGTVWYRYHPTQDRVLVATTFGSDHSTALTVFSGKDFGNLKEIGCDLDAIGASQVVFRGSTDETYFFQVAAPAGGGNLVFNLDPLGATQRVSVSSAAREANGSSQAAALSADGRYVAFQSAAQNLVEGDDNSCPAYPGCIDVFVHDRLTRRTERVSVSSEGHQSNHASLYPAISGDGRYVAYLSFASNLVPNDTNGQWDAFVHDRVTRRTERVSVDSEERQGRYARDLPIQSGDPNMTPSSISLTYDGRYVAFASDFPNLVPNDNNACFDSGIVDWWGATIHPEPPARAPAETVGYNCRDVFVRDRTLGTTTRVSVASSGAEGQGDSASAYITSDGRYVAFSSDAENLDPRDGNGYRDAFVHDRHTRRTELVSLSTSGEQGNANSGGINESGDTSISSDGRYVAFLSTASNFAVGDSADQDVFLRDRATGRTTILPGTFAEEGSDRSTVASAEGLHAAMSADGRFVASTFKVVVVRSGETKHVGHILVYDRLADRTTRVSVSSSGEEANDFSVLPFISADGQVVGFHSKASNLVDNDRNAEEDVFIHELPWAR